MSHDQSASDRRVTSSNASTASTVSGTFALLTVALLVCTVHIVWFVGPPAPVELDEYVFATDNRIVDPNEYHLDLGFAICGLLLAGLLGVAFGFVAVRRRRGSVAIPVSAIMICAMAMIASLVVVATGPAAS